MIEDLKAIKHVEIRGRENTARVHLGDGSVIEALGAVGFSGGRIGLIAGLEEGKPVVSDLVRAGSPGIGKFLSTAMIGTGDTKRPFLTMITGRKVSF